MILLVLLLIARPAFVMLVASVRAVVMVVWRMLRNVKSALLVLPGSLVLPLVNVICAVMAVLVLASNAVSLV